MPLPSVHRHTVESGLAIVAAGIDKRHVLFEQLFSRGNVTSSNGSVERHRAEPDEVETNETGASASKEDSCKRRQGNNKLIME